MSIANVYEEAQNGKGPRPSATPTKLFNVDDATYGSVCLYAYGTTVVSDGTTGYAKGCIFVDTDAAASNIFYTNEGTTASAAFKVATS